MSKSQSMSNRAHIVKREAGWALKKEGSQRATKIYETKDQAVKGAEKIRKSGSDVIIHKKDGSIQKWVKSGKK